jgi:hypothetical protein
MAAPSVGRIVHYVSYGTPGGEFKSECKAAVIAGVHSEAAVDLVVLNPGGIFFHEADYSPDHKGGTWHWPEMV